MAYFPNGTAGHVLDAQCVECPFGEGPCEIFLVQHEFNYAQCSDGQEKLRKALTILVDDNGVCRMRKRMQDHGLIGPDGQQRLPGFEAELRDGACWEQAEG